MEKKTKFKVPKNGPNNIWAFPRKWPNKENKSTGDGTQKRSVHIRIHEIYFWSFCKVLNKRGKFISTINAMMQEFHFVNPDIHVKLINVYATCFYGSVLWNLYSPQVDKLYKTQNVTIRNVFGLPWKAHRNFIRLPSSNDSPL